MVGLHWEKDGLFFQGDSPRHAMNGIFWGDLIREGLSDPVGYTKSYYARYPAITPTRYPPVFYLFEALAFELVGPSPFVAKGLVQMFALVTGIYLLVGMRRWISPASGILAGLVFLTPGMIRWSNAVMLNVPALAFATASLYHLRCAIDASDPKDATKQLCRSIVFWFLAIGTHPIIGFIGLISLAWLAMAGKLSLLFRKQMRLVTIGSLTILLLLMTAVAFLSGEQAAQARVEIEKLIRPHQLLFYLRELPKLVGWTNLTLATAGLAICFPVKSFRSEGIQIALAVCITYLCLTPIWALDSRYILMACPGTVFTVGLLFEWIRFQTHNAIVFLGFLVLGTIGVVQAPGVILRNCAPMEQVIQHFETIAPSEPVIYHGTYDGTFVFYLRLRDPDFRRQAVLFGKLMETTEQSIPTGQGRQIQKTLLDSGIGWLIVEKRVDHAPTKRYGNLENAIRTDEFEWVNSIPIDLGWSKRLDIYRIKSKESHLEDRGPRSFTVDEPTRSWKPLER